VLVLAARAVDAQAGTLPDGAIAAARRLLQPPGSPASINLHPGDGVENTRDRAGAAAADRAARAGDPTRDRARAAIARVAP